MHFKSYRVWYEDCISRLVYTTAHFAVPQAPVRVIPPFPLVVVVVVAVAVAVAVRHPLSARPLREEVHAGELDDADGDEDEAAGDVVVHRRGVRDARSVWPVVDPDERHRQHDCDAWPGWWRRDR